MKKLYTFLLFFIALDVISAQTLLSGKVVDTDGQPLGGVTINERGTANGTSSKLDGTYSFYYRGKNPILVFSYIGYATQEIQLSGRTELNVTMEPDASLLDQVVIVGTRRQNRVQTETPVPVDIINVGAVTSTTARADVTSLLNFSAPSFNYNKQSGSDGADHIDLATLRGLGPDQTLVLINGKRRHQTSFLATFGTRGRGASGTDLGAIPVAAIDRVEILRDGASAQYGSDAMAGVINIILKKNVRTLSADLGFSGYYDQDYNPAFRSETDLKGEYIYENKLDGATYNIGANYGLPIGKKGGFLNLTAFYANAAKTYRQEMDGVLPVNIYRRPHGDASMQGYSAMFNAELPIRADRATFYAFGGFNRKESDAYAFTRNFSARPDRFPTDANGNVILVDGITMKTDGGEIFFTPHIQTEMQDISGAVGLKGTTSGNWNWDMSNTTGVNGFHFYGDKTFNAGLGTRQTHFDDGGFSLLQNTTNLNLSKAVPTVLSGLNVAFGGEFRLENYQITAGEAASYANYDENKATGAQGFPGYQPGDEVDANRSCVGGYLDLELDATESLLLGGAMRFENYSDFGSTFNWKGTMRYKLLHNLNVRSSISTGFRAPSLQQINFSSTFTTVQGTTIQEVRIAPNTSKLTRAAGIPDLKQETSENVSAGFSWRPFQNLNVTFDAYQVKVKDRVVLSGSFSADDPTLSDALTSELQAAGVSSAQFFTNAVNTTNRGIDVVVDFVKKFQDKRQLRVLLAGNVQHMSIDDINVPSALDDTDAHRANFFSDREQAFLLASAPNRKASVSLEYTSGHLTIGMRHHYFGKVRLLGYGEDGSGIAPAVPLDNGNGYVADEYIYRPKVSTDIFAGYKIGKHLNLNLGADNIFNVHPDLGFAPGAAGWAFNNETGGPWDAVQMGGSGTRLFLRMGLTF